MADAFSLVQQAALDQFLTRKMPNNPGSRLKKFCYALALILFCAGLLFLFGASFFWLAANFSLPVVLFFMAGLSFIICALCVVTAFAIIEYKARSMKRMKDEVMEMADLALAIAEEELAISVRQNPKTTLLISSFAGFLAGDKIYRN
jgi:hypothetical protein